MGHRFHLTLVQRESGFQQGFPVACGAGPGDLCPSRQPLAQLIHGLHGGLDGIALVVGIIRIQQLPLFADKGHFGGGGTGVDA